MKGAMQTSQDQEVIDCSHLQSQQFDHEMIILVLGGNRAHDP